MAVPTFTPTTEQQYALGVFSTGKDLVLEAGAGTGKTSTLQLLAHNTGGRDGLYVAYNKAIQTEAGSKFPSWVPCRTAHSLAYRAIVDDGMRERMNGDRLPWYKVASRLGIGEVYVQGTKRLATGTMARLAAEMVGRFCNTGDPQITVRHRPFVEGIEDLDDLGETLLPFAQLYWADITSKTGRFRFEHDHYLKIWQLGDPTLPGEIVLFDEAQDANGCIASIIAKHDGQRIYTGDRAQAIYGWRGAVDSMDIPDVDVAWLTQSFRFGQRIADVANEWLAQLDTPLRLVGNPDIDSAVDQAAGGPRAVLCRTNGTAFAELIGAQAAGIKAHLMGGGNEMKSFCRGADELKQRGSSNHRDLVAFSTWLEVQEYVDETAGAGDLKTMVKIIDTYGTDRVIRALDDMYVDEPTAELTVSTAHKAKGREWDSVRIAGDFEQRRDENDALIPLTTEEIMLRYVAVTRAQYALYRGPLAPPINMGFMSLSAEIQSEVQQVGHRMTPDEAQATIGLEERR